MFVPRTNLSLQLKKWLLLTFLAVLEAIENLTLAFCKRQQARRQRGGGGGGARGVHAPPPQEPKRSA